MNATYKLLVLVGPFALAGCAATSAPVPPPASDHPASPQAAAAPMPQRSNTLALEPGGAPAAHDRPTTQPTSAVAAAYTCPHHPEVTQATPGTCPKCKMKLEPVDQATPAGPPDAKGSPDHAGHDGHDSHEGHGGHAK